MRPSRFLFLLLACAVLLRTGIAAEVSAGRQKLVDVLLAEPSAQVDAVRGLIGIEDSAITPTLTAWRQGEVFIHTAVDGRKIPFMLSTVPDNRGGFPALAIADGRPIVGADGAPLSLKATDLTPVETTGAVRRAIRDVLELAGVNDPAATTRVSAIERLGQSQKPEHRPLLAARLVIEKEGKVRKALEIALGLIDLASTDVEQQLKGAQALTDNYSLSGSAQFKTLIETATQTPGSVDPRLVQAAKIGIQKIDTHFQLANFVGTLFRGLSSGSVLLVMALGLAITFGLMGVINMAHGEVMVVGAYATFLVQNLFISWFGNTGTGFSWYFIAALPAAFLASALVGIALERSVIRFLYRRPLESLLATWGVSLVLQQGFRLIFGAANVQILSPAFLQGNVTINDVTLAYNRLFVIGFAVIVVAGMWLLLTRTPLGLTIRAVTQNRAMASCMGVRTDRVNTMTFAFGSGLAGLAGACLTQLGNVGPGLGQTHIVDNFMVVVSGGVGNLFGTVFAALGIGTTQLGLEPWVGAVLAKILVLFGIILFLQWKPGGLFPSRSRSLD